jgi:hypothetical protein
VDTQDLLPIVLASSVLSAIVAGGITLLSQKMNLNHQAKSDASRLRDLDRQRVRENSEFMMTLIPIAHGTPADGRTHLAIAEQMAAVELMVANANEYPELRRPTDVFLTLGTEYAHEQSRGRQNSDGWLDMEKRYAAAHARLIRT